MKTSIRYAIEKDKTHCDVGHTERENIKRKGYVYYDTKGGQEKVT